MIDLTNVTKTFASKTIFDNLNLHIDTGEMVAIMGPSGSGKSTLLNIIGLIDDFSSGTYEFDGVKNIKPNSRQANRTIREKISYIFQNFALIDDETVGQNLAIAQKYLKLNKAQRQKQIDDALQTVGLNGYADRKTFELSGGEQQRVAVARCLIKPSKLILADEPTGSLDGDNRSLILNELKNINRLGKTVIIVTHDPLVAKECSRMIAIGSSSED
ncbi:ABC transporter ATP-binding protein [Lacticaseibacillus zeae]|uniref:ABC transporter ATP-binding protein n=1 Tax=Lacticaseibacillus zeae subsp. silagei TaxID=3068307 RepID=A0ABD7Z837_LACZE|nr:MULTISPECIES: ABC transporter ATP-binding protein [Lacticaseibacillus]MDE3316094.1 ABC transporter ATP-binding protein [Lacticaseibacillus zeae]OFR93117.1 bacteriocin ABC transporter ATP-binding protein [Lactobacillus sp. HMSC068F07]WLV83134.1 ABC transporter ATP-binding protein [Lacticaseibacillus sp. NCIMB 15475]WLV85883.1 ABC transporter ATP-binding protein [Lacticaseibacillus sp. NCIMB 15474]